MGMEWEEYLRAHPTDRFNRTFPLDEPAWERTLSLVGRIVSHAAWAETLLGGLASVDHPGVNVTVVEAEIDWGPHGRSGDSLIEALSSLSQRSAAVRNVANRYAAWAPIRNQIIHGSWIDEDHKTGAFELSKPNRGFHKKARAAPFIRVKMDHVTLIEIAYAFYGLSHDTLRIQMEAIAGAPIEKWPFPDYAPESEWWPPDWTAL